MTRPNRIRKRICDELARAIDRGELPPGAPLPSSRQLALQLGVSRATVVKCFSDLESMFYIESSSTRGYFVSMRRQSLIAAPAARASRRNGIQLSEYGQRLQIDYEKFLFTPDFSDLNYGAPPRDLLPIVKWQQHLRAFAQKAPQISSPQVLGLTRLRHSLAGFLNRSKGLSCLKREVMLFSGTLTSMNLFCRLLLNPGELAAVEDPGFGGIRNVAREHGVKLFNVPVDDEGLIVERLYEQPQVRLVYVTSGHHDPTGIQLSEDRKRQLLNWAKSSNSWIIEDDFDGHFQYGKNLSKPLKSMDEDNCVIYLSTFWKVLYPLTNLGYCVVPEPLIPLVEKVKINADGFPDLLQQQTLAAMIDDGYLERFIRRLQNTYQNRRHSLIYSLTTTFGKQIAIQPATSGTYCLVLFHDWTESAILQAAKLAELPMISIAGYYYEEPPHGEFIIDFSCLPESAVAEKVKNFARNLGV